MQPIAARLVTGDYDQLLLHQFIADGVWDAAKHDHGV